MGCSCVPAEASGAVVCQRSFSQRSDMTSSADVAQNARLKRRRQNARALACCNTLGTLDALIKNRVTGNEAS